MGLLPECKVRRIPLGIPIPLNGRNNPPKDRREEEFSYIGHASCNLLCILLLIGRFRLIILLIFFSLVCPQKA